MGIQGAASALGKCNSEVQKWPHSDGKMPDCFLSEFHKGGSASIALYFPFETDDPDAVCKKLQLGDYLSNCRKQFNNQYYNPANGSLQITGMYESIRDCIFINYAPEYIVKQAVSRFADSVIAWTSRFWSNPPSEPDAFSEALKRAHL